MSENLIELLTKMNEEVQNQKLRLLPRVDFSTKIKIFRDQKPIFHKLKSVHVDVDNVVLSLASLILAIDNVAKELGIINLNAAKLRVKNNKAKIKRQKLLNYWAIVRTLRREQKMSFRDISDYFAKYHKLVVSYSTIYQLWNELENKTHTKEN